MWLGSEVVAEVLADGGEDHRSTVSRGNQVKEHPDPSHHQKPTGTGVPMATWLHPSADNNMLLT